MSEARLEEIAGLLGIIPDVLRTFAALDVTDLDRGIEDALARIGEFAGVDRAYLFLVTDDGIHADNTHEWCASGIEPQREHLQNLPLDAVPGWIERLGADEIIYIPDVQDLGPERADERAILEPQGIRSTINVPLTAQGRFVGFIGFDSVRGVRSWATETQLLLRAVADLIAGALLRRAGYQELIRREERTTAMLRHASDVVLTLDASGTIRDLGPSTVRVLGWDGQDAPAVYLDAVHDEDRDPVARALRTARDHPGVEVAVPDHRLAHADNTWRWFSATTIDLRHHPAIAGIIVNAHDVTERKAAERRLSHRAHHDPLTGLANRALLISHLRRALPQAAAAGQVVAVVFLDLDRFKLINDTLGHSMGDELLVAVAERLRSRVRDRDVVARLGGDEFVILLDAVPDALAATDRARQLLDTLSAPVTLHGIDHHVTASAGLVIPEPHADPDTILADADAAMYQAKASGRARLQHFDVQLRDQLVRRMHLAGELKRAIDTGGLDLAYQPIHAIQGPAVGVEALVRWSHPTLGPITPDEFVAIAEEHGTILALGNWVLREALCQLAVWRRHHPTLTISVNLSPQQLRDDDLVVTVEKALATAGLPRQALCLELTESALMDDPGRGRDVLQQLRARGVSVAIDDFGTGYSSLAYLRELPVTSLKIDQTFVADLREDVGDPRVVAAIARLASELGLQTVAEGVETTHQLSTLAALGVDFVQGFLLDRPMSAAACSRRLAERASQTFMPIARSSSRT